MSIAWKDDSAFSYQIVLCTENKFGYAVVKKTRMGEKRSFYCGTYKDNLDTLFLKYDKNKKPPGFTDYLVWATPRHYLIQFFNGKPQGMFLNARHYYGIYVR